MAVLLFAESPLPALQPAVIANAAVSFTCGKGLGKCEGLQLFDVERLQRAPDRHGFLHGGGRCMPPSKV